MKHDTDSCGGFGLCAFEWVKRGVVVVIALLFNLIWIGAVEAQPRAIKAGAAPQGNEWAEVFNGSLQGREMGLEKGVNVVGPVSDRGVDGAKLSKNGGTKGAASDGPAASINSAIAKPSNKTSGEDTASYWPKIGKKEIYEIIQGALIGGGMMAFMLWMLGIYDAPHMKPNVEPTGVRRLYGARPRAAPG